MQRGLPTTKIDKQPSGQFIYQMICQELNSNICRREQSKVSLKRCSDAENKNIIMQQLDRLEIEFELLSKLKNEIEDPSYYDADVLV